MLKRKLNDEPEKPARRVYNEHITQLALDDAAVAAPLSLVERSLQRYKVRNRPPLPQTRLDLILQPEHTVTTDGRRFLLIDDGQADRIVVYATDEQIQRLCHLRTWWMDGTFTSNPEIFAQLYTVNLKIDGEFAPQCWCLLPDKTAATYTRLFHLLKQAATAANQQLQPTCIHIDFEQAVMQAVPSEFQIDPIGCLFHFSQSVLRHLQQCAGLQNSYNTNTPPAVRTWIRRLIALPLLPPIRIDQAFAAIVNHAPNVPGKDTINNYVYDTYVD